MTKGSRFVPAMGLVFALLIASGCVGGESSAPNTTSAPPSSTISISDSADQPAGFGTVVGTVTDDEKQPLSRVSVGILELKGTATSDENGSFSFTNVPVGKYKIAASALGYQDQGQSVEVLADSTSMVNFTLAPLAIIDAYHTTSLWKGKMSCGLALVPWCGILDEASQDYGTPNPTDEHWLFRWQYADGVAPVQVIFELVWTPSVPGTAQEFAILGLAGFNEQVSGSSPLQLVVNNTFADDVKKDPEFKFSVGIYPELMDPVIDQRFDLYRTDFFGLEAPDGWSVLTEGQ